MGIVREMLCLAEVLCTICVNYVCQCAGTMWRMHKTMSEASNGVAPKLKGCPNELWDGTGIAIIKMQEHN